MAAAAALAAPHRTVLLLERNARLGLETTSRNSGVIHAGIYYAPGSAKARFCVAGRDALYRLCAERGVPHRRIGKLIVATSAEEEPALETLRARAAANGVLNLEALDGPAVRALEPNVKAGAALFSRDSGIVDPLALVAALWREARDGGAEAVLATELVGLDRIAGGWKVTSRTAADATESHESRVVVNAAGLASDRVAALAGIDVDAAGYRLHYVKGDYFSVTRAQAAKVTRLVYPVPPVAGHGLGVHWTLDLEGRARLGPDATWIERVGTAGLGTAGGPSPSAYAVDPAKRQAFLAAARRFLPFLESNDLAPEMSGIRPSLRTPGSPERDFVVVHETGRDMPGLVNLVGIESPGLTSSLAIARHVRDDLTASGLID